MTQRCCYGYYVCEQIIVEPTKVISTIGELFREYPKADASVVFCDGLGMITLMDAVRSGFGNTCLCIVDTETILRRTRLEWEPIDGGYRVY